jgi:signal peptide peptidase SppA
MKNYSAIIAAMNGSVWAIMPNKLESMVGVLQTRIAGLTVDAETLQKYAAANRQERRNSGKGAVGVLPVMGVLSHRMNMINDMSGGTSTEQLGRDFDALMANKDVGSIMLDIDSPGGNYAGTPELAAKIFAARGVKPVTAMVNAMAGSAAFWLAAAADEIVVTPSGDIGSHGVRAVHYDMSVANEADGVKVTYVTYGAYKAEYNEDEPLGEEAHVELQRRVNEAGATFTRDLAKFRGVSASVVLDRFGQGRMYGAEEAVSRGMADRIDTFEATIERLISATGSRRRGRSVESQRWRLVLYGRI